MQKIMTRTIVSGLLILIGSCTDENAYARPENSEAAILPDHTTPLSLGHEGLVVNVNQRLIKEYGEFYAGGGVVELALSEFFDFEPHFLTLMIDLPVTYPEGTLPPSPMGADQSEMNSWYEFLAPLYGPEDHAYNFVQFTGNPSEYVERFPMLHRVVKWLDWEFQLYFEISEAGTARSLMVCELEDISMPPGEDWPRMCLTIFRYNGVVLLTILNSDELSWWQDHRAALARVIAGNVAPWQPEEGLETQKTRFSLRIDGVTIRPVLGSDLDFSQLSRWRGEVPYSLIFNASTNLSAQGGKQGLSEVLVSDAGTFPTEMTLRLHTYQKDWDKKARTVCETTQREIEGGEPVVITNCEFDFVYRSLWDVGVTYRTATGSPYPINADMVTKFLDTIVDLS